MKNALLLSPVVKRIVDAFTTYKEGFLRVKG